MRIIIAKQEDGTFSIRVKPTKRGEGRKQACRDILPGDVKAAIPDLVHEFVESAKGGTDAG